MTQYVKTSKAFDEAGFKETARLMKLLNETHTTPKSLQGDPMWLYYETIRNSKQ